MTTETVNVTSVIANGNGNANTATTMTTTTTTTTLAKNTETQKKNRIQVSNTKKPLFFYVNLAKRYIQQHNEVELSALGMAITTVVTIAEILKNNGLAVEKKVTTSTVAMKDETRGKLVQKAKIEIVLGKSEKFDSLMTNNTASAGAAATDQPTAAETQKGQNKK
ncbi:Alba domain-containing protein [Heracleum sosnowskyi]|uniref:Alba domain-containing protein n=1 Tax=Heracleum sosnowskyi TaxID=360622 RepID=A0AAD8GLW4_9APIA|nr:Alba domain-containing protein [Heracleum sosnowskyi]